MKYLVKFREKQSSAVVARGGKEGQWGVFNDTLRQDEKSSGNWLHNNVNVLNTLNCIL